MLWALLPQVTAERNRDGILLVRGKVSSMTLLEGTIRKLAKFEVKKLAIRTSFCEVTHDHPVHHITLTVLHPLKPVSNIHVALLYQLKFQTNKQSFLGQNHFHGADMMRIAFLTLKRTTHNPTLCVLGRTSHQVFAQLYCDISRHHLAHFLWPSVTLM